MHCNFLVFFINCLSRYKSQTVLIFCVFKHSEWWWKKQVIFFNNYLNHLSSNNVKQVLCSSQNCFSSDIFLGRLEGRFCVSNIPSVVDLIWFLGSLSCCIKHFLLSFSWQTATLTSSCRTLWWTWEFIFFSTMANSKGPEAANHDPPSTILHQWHDVFILVHSYLFLYFYQVDNLVLDF